MLAISGVDLAKVNETASKAFAKGAEVRVSDYLRGLLLQQHNLAMKAMRLRNEADQAEASMGKLNEQISKIRSGDWSAIEPLELTSQGNIKDKE